MTVCGQSLTTVLYLKCDNSDKTWKPRIIKFRQNKLENYKNFNFKQLIY